MIKKIPFMSLFRKGEYIYLTTEEKKIYKLTQCNTILNRELLDKRDVYLKNVQNDYKDIYGNKGVQFCKVMQLNKDNIKLNRDDITQTPCQQNGLSSLQNSQAILLQSPHPSYIFPCQNNPILPQSPPPSYISPYQNNPVLPQSPPIILLSKPSAPTYQVSYPPPMMAPMNIPSSQYIAPVQIQQNTIIKNIYIN